MDEVIEMKGELVHHCIDSRHWEGFVYRPGDIVIVSWGKCGTTWVQQIVGQLLFGADPGLVLPEISVWLDRNWPSAEYKIHLLEKQEHRRFLKSHLSADILPRSDQATYIYIGRDARDAVWSLHHHLLHLPNLISETLDEEPETDVYRFWRHWMDDDAYPMWPFWEHVKSWWDLRHEPNVQFVHFSDLKKDMPGEIRRIAAFLGIRPDEQRWEQLLEYCSFEWMKAHPRNVVPLGMLLPEDEGAFMHRGANCRWNAVLSEQDSAEYEARARQELGEECAAWLMYGATGK